MKIWTDNRLVLKILSGLVAIILWIAITYTEDPVISQTLNGIEINFLGEETLHSNGLIVTNKESLPNLSAVIRGSRSSVISAMEVITASADVSHISAAGSNTIEIEYNCPVAGVTLSGNRTNEITVETEKIVSRSIPIKTKTINQDKNTAYMIKSDSEEDSVKIRGAESRVYEIAYASAEIDVQSITKDGTQKYLYKFYNDSDDVVSQDDIIYKSFETVKVHNKAYQRVTLPIKAVLDENAAENYSINVKNISSSSIDVGIESGADISELTAVVKFTSESETSKEIILDEPEGIYIPEKYKTVTVNYQLTPKILGEVEIPVTAENVPEGKKYSINPQKIKISVKCAEDDIAADKIKATADLSNMISGEKRTVPVIIKADENISVIGEYSVEAELN